MKLFDKNKKLYMLMLSTSVLSMSSTQPIYGGPAFNSSAPLVAGPTELDDGDNGPIFYVPQSQLNNGNITVAYNNSYGTGPVYYVSSGHIYTDANHTTSAGDDFGTMLTGLNPTLTSTTANRATTILGGTTATASAGRIAQPVNVFADGKLEIKDSTHTFDKKVKVEGGVLTIGDGTNESTVTFSEGLDLNGSISLIKKNTTITIPAPNKLTISNGKFSIEGTNGKKSFEGSIEGKRALANFINTTLHGQFEIDPSLFRVSGANSINTIGGNVNTGILTLGSGPSGNPANDSHNVMLFDPNSSLSVTTKVTLHNRNALIVGYKPSGITPQGFTDLLTTALMEAGSNNTGAFDDVFTLALNDDGTSTGILQPIDATVTNNDSTYKFNIIQSTTGVKLSIDENAEPKVGTDVSAIIQQYIANNPIFGTVIGYDASSAGYSARATNIVNALIGSFEASKNSIGEAPTDQILAAFKFKPAQLARNQSTVSRAESILKAIADKGPVDLSSDQYRIWVSPFTNMNNTKGKNAGRDWILGSLVGVEYRDLKSKYAIGLIGGANFGHTRQKAIKENGSGFTGINMGLYGSYGAWEGGRVDLMYMRSLNFLTGSRMTDIGRIARNTHKLEINMLDVQTSHLIKIPGNEWSVRFNIGHTYTHDKSDGYTETGAAHRNKRIGVKKGRSYEAFGGIGVRWNYRGEEWRTRITGLYEYGHEYKKHSSIVKTSHGTAFNVHTFAREKANKDRTHYATLYTTINNKTGWKFYLGYNGTFTQKSVGTGLTLKAEYRF